MDKDIQMLEAILDGSNQMVQVSDAQTYNYCMLICRPGCSAVMKMSRMEADIVMNI